MDNKFYGLIGTHKDLGELERLALQKDKHAVGVTKNGRLYKYDLRIRQAVEIKPAEAAEILECTLDDIDKIIETKGRYILPILAVDAANNGREGENTESKVNEPYEPKDDAEGDSSATDEDEEYDEDETDYDEEDYEEPSLSDIVETIEEAADEIQGNNTENANRLLNVLERIAASLEKLVEATVLD